MAQLKIAKLGNPILRKIAEPVSKEECLSSAFQTLIDDMIEMMLSEDGIGISAPQVFESKQLFVVRSNSNARYPEAPDLPLLILINPKILECSDEMIEGWEGCLSVDNLRGKVKRHAMIRISGFDRQMNAVSFKAEGFFAIVLQHEMDHMMGKVFLDQMSDFSTLTQLEEFERYWHSSYETV